MWSQIISSSSHTPKMVISPYDNYRPVTIFEPCPVVVILSDNYCMYMNYLASNSLNISYIG